MWVAGMLPHAMRVVSGAACMCARCVSVAAILLQDRESQGVHVGIVACRMCVSGSSWAGWERQPAYAVFGDSMVARP